MLKTKQPNSFLFILSTNHNSCSLFQHFIIIYEIARTLFKKRLETKTIASQTFFTSLKLTLHFANCFLTNYYEKYTQSDINFAISRETKTNSFLRLSIFNHKFFCLFFLLFFKCTFFSSSGVNRL